VRQEAFIGVLYVFATAATVLVVDRSPQGAEHVKKMLGGRHSVSERRRAHEAQSFSTAIIGVIHWFIRRPLLAAAADHTDSPLAAGKTAFWDLVFYLSFGVGRHLFSRHRRRLAGVFASSSFPALVGSLFSSHIGMALVIGWIAGAAASASGIFGSFLLDAPTGAVTVMAFCRGFWWLPGRYAPSSRLPRRSAAAIGNSDCTWAGSSLCLVLGLSGAWVVVAPRRRSSGSSGDRNRKLESGPIAS